jgi:hypothetical protein
MLTVACGDRYTFAALDGSAQSSDVAAIGLKVVNQDRKVALEGLK